MCCCVCRDHKMNSCKVHVEENYSDLLEMTSHLMVPRESAAQPWRKRRLGHACDPCHPESSRHQTSRLREVAVRVTV